jgi:hypothetical protein
MNCFNFKDIIDFHFMTTDHGLKILNRYGLGLEYLLERTIPTNQSNMMASLLYLDLDYIVTGVY